MKQINLSPRMLATALLLLLGVIIAAVPKNTTTPYKLDAVQILDELKSGTQYLEPEQVAQMLVEKDPYLQLIDIRSQAEFEKFSLPGAVNVPFDNILAADYTELFDQDTKINVFYGNGTTQANEAWMLLRQLGYENINVLRGGLNYWAEVIMNPTPPSGVNPNDDIARYNFRIGASQALGGGAQQTGNDAKASSPAAKPAGPKPGGKKKKVAGGCS
ncbi:MAG: rhodanese-like domain-containing protein [Bacteroidales bacterium]|nr:rhodanese-like domain-containing protein [Bacteroidales bacterium]